VSRARRIDAGRRAMDARIQTIRYLASFESQERYIVRGTASEYLLPSQLVNDALELVRLVDSGMIASWLSATQRDRLAELKLALEAVDVEAPNDQLVRRDPAWAAVRTAAGRFLAEYEGTVHPPAG